MGTTSGPTIVIGRPCAGRWAGPGWCLVFVLSCRFGTTWLFDPLCLSRPGGFGGARRIGATGFVGATGIIGAAWRRFTSAGRGRGPWTIGASQQLAAPYRFTGGSSGLDYRPGCIRSALATGAGTGSSCTIGVAFFLRSAKVEPECLFDSGQSRVVGGFRSRIRRHFKCLAPVLTNMSAAIGQNKPD